MERRQRKQLEQLEEAAKAAHTWNAAPRDTRSGSANNTTEHNTLIDAETTLENVRANNARQTRRGFALLLWEETVGVQEKGRLLRLPLPTSDCG